MIKAKREQMKEKKAKAKAKQKEKAAEAKAAMATASESPDKPQVEEPAKKKRKLDQDGMSSASNINHRRLYLEATEKRDPSTKYLPRGTSGASWWGVKINPKRKANASRNAIVN